MVKSFRIIATFAVFLLLGWVIPAKSLQEQQDHPKEQEKQQEQANPAEKRQEPPKAEKQNQQQASKEQDQAHHQQQQAKAKQNQQQKQQDNSKKQEQQIAKSQQDQQRKGQQQRQDAKVQQDQQGSHQQQDNRSVQQTSPAHVHQQQVAWQGDRAHSWQTEHRTWQQRGGYHGYRVPDDRFRSYYGQSHGFRIYTLPVVYVSGHRRFQYGGYWFGLVDPWPEYWSNDWYDNDDIYVDYYGDGYYLYNRRYPGDRIAISFYLN